MYDHLRGFSCLGPDPRTRGASPVALGALLDRLRPARPDDRRVLRVYREHIHDLVRRVRVVFDEWVQLREVEPDNMRLANAAAVDRWELMRLSKTVERLHAPRAASANQRAVQDALVGAARACQLLANGYRSHKSEAVCDGQALLVESVAALVELAGQLEDR